MRRALFCLLLLAVPGMVGAQILNPLTRVVYISADGDCDNDPCSHPTKLLCVESAGATVIYVCGSGGFYVPSAGGGGAPGGSNQQVQFNNSSAFGGDAGFTYDAATDRLTVGGNIVLSAVGATVDGVDLQAIPFANVTGTASRVAIIGVAGTGTTDSDLAWNGVTNTLTITGATPITLATANATVDNRNLDLVPASPEVINICASGCKYSTLAAACAAETSTAAAPKAFHVLAGKYAQAETMCSGQDHGTIYGDGIGTTILQSLTSFGFGDVEGNDCVASDSACKGALNLGTSKNMTVYGLSLWGSRGLWWNGAGVAGGVNYVFLNEFKTTTTNGDEDCFFFRGFAAGAEMNANLNLCTTGVDGFTVDRDATTIYRTAGNVMHTTATIESQTAMFAYRSIPCEVYSDGDIIEATGGKAGANALIGFQLDGNSSGTSCGGGARVVIKRPHITLTNTTSSPNGGDVYGVYIDPDAATELGSGGSVQVYSPDIKVHTNDTGAVSYGIFNALTNFTDATVHSGKIRATGGASGTRRDISATTNATVKVAGVDYQSSNSDVVVPGIDQVQLTASGKTTLSGAAQYNADNNPFQILTTGTGTGLLLDNTDGASSESSPIAQFCEGSASNFCYRMGTGISGSQDEFDIEFGSTPMVRYRAGADIAQLFLSRFFLGNTGSSIEIGGGNASDNNRIEFQAGSTTAIQRWNDANDRMTFENVDLMRMDGVTTGATLDTAGDFSIDTSANQWVYYSGGAVRVYTPTRIAPIALLSPTSSDDPVVLRASATPITIQNIHCLVDPADSGESVVITVRECDANGDSCAGVDGATTITCGNTDTADDGSLSNPTIDLNDYIDIDVGTVTGTVSRLSITIAYAEDRQ